MREPLMQDVMAFEVHQNDRSYMYLSSAFQLSAIHYMVGGYGEDLKNSTKLSNWGVGACRDNTVISYMIAYLRTL